VKELRNSGWCSFFTTSRDHHALPAATKVTGSNARCGPARRHESALVVVEPSVKVGQKPGNSPDLRRRGREVTYLSAGTCSSARGPRRGTIFGAVAPGRVNDRSSRGPPQTAIQRLRRGWRCADVGFQALRSPKQSIKLTRFARFDRSPGAAWKTRIPSPLPSPRFAGRGQPISGTRAPRPGRR
jgi:hypothetical protein